MIRYMLSLSTVEGVRKGRVMLDGVPLCTDRTPDEALAYLNDLVRTQITKARPGRALTVAYWDGDTGYEYFTVVQSLAQLPLGFAPDPTKRWQIVNTWNGGKGGRVVEFTSKGTGVDGHNECFKWVLDHTPFSFSEATTHQGYTVEQVPE